MAIAPKRQTAPGRNERRARRREKLPVTTYTGLSESPGIGPNAAGR